MGKKSLFDAGVLASDPDPARAAREQRPRQDDPEAGQDDGDGAAPHLADTDGRGVDEGRSAAQGSHPRRLRQEKQVCDSTLNSTVSKSGSRNFIRSSSKNMFRNGKSHKYRGVKLQNNLAQNVRIEKANKCNIVIKIKVL